MKIQTKLLSLAGLTLAACTHTKEQQPNVIYIFPDQYRNSSFGFWSDDDFSSHVGWQGDPVVTPNLDKFARQSLVLSEAVSNCPVSSPHRGMLLTGMYPERSGVALNCMSLRPESSLREDAECISDVFSEAGYDCAYIGKLHVDFPTPNDPQRPGHYVNDKSPEWDAYTPRERRHGFNYWYSYGTYDVHKHPHYWDTEGNRHEISEWSVSHEIGKAIEYITNRNNERDGDKPFFMMIGLNPPHSPYASIDDCDTESFALYADKSLDELYVRPNADKRMKKAESARYYFANVSGIDREFGELMQILEDEGLTDNTIVVFASDHGETMCSHSLTDPKNSIYRESMNMPFIVRYPNHIEPRVDNLLLSSPDIMPTLLGLAGLSELIPNQVEGRDFSSLFMGKESSIQRPTSALYMRNLDGTKDKDGIVSGFFPEARGIKSATHTMELKISREGKLVGTLLFDDVADPYQMQNLDTKQNSELFALLCRELAVLLKENNDVWYRERILSHIIPYDEI